MQKPSANAGMGSSLGGGTVENAFGSETVKVLTGWTIKGIVTFFIVTIALSMLQIHRHTHKKSMHYNIDINNITEEQLSTPTETTKE
jgi:preprotein translocase subunit SecG